MPRNILIFSDGTGKSSGIYLDEDRSNIYKLYRATRVGPDSRVDPAEQIAFYDPGVGTAPRRDGLFRRISARLLVAVGKATGLGITGNVVECYAALIRLYEPGDRIFLFGFSRGAYTVRLLGGVMAYCGIPRSRFGKPLKRDRKTSMRIARHAVTKIYQHMRSMPFKDASPRQKELLEQRKMLARRFRERYDADREDGSGIPAAAPHFIGVFDTVSSLFNPAFMLVLLSLVLGFLTLLSLLVASHAGVKAVEVATWIFGLPAALAVVLYIRSHLKWPGTIRARQPGERTHPWWRTFRFSNWRMKFDDYELSDRVQVARHALSIDEGREAFYRVPWTNDPDESAEGKPDDWFQQVWFAGVHSDIGGGYADREARLSDITLAWMAEAAKAEGLKIEPSLLHLFPDPAGRQHDEVKSTAFGILGRTWRDIPTDAPLHDSVIARMEAGPVLHYDVMKPYRPPNLRRHERTRRFYED